MLYGVIVAVNGRQIDEGSFCVVGGITFRSEPYGNNDAGLRKQPQSELVHHRFGRWNIFGHVNRRPLSCLTSSPTSSAPSSSTTNASQWKSSTLAFRTAKRRCPSCGGADCGDTIFCSPPNPTTCRSGGTPCNAVCRSTR